MILFRNGPLDLKKYNCIFDNNGQAIFEFVIFLPFMLILFFLLVTVGSSINGSINQQKSVRGYFYYLHKGNSTLPSKWDLDHTYRGSEIKYAGSVAFGWKEFFKGGTEKGSPVAPCYKIGLFDKSGIGDCEDSYTLESPSSQFFIKPKTVYGICGMLFEINSNGGNIPHFKTLNGSISSQCSLQKK